MTINVLKLTFRVWLPLLIGYSAFGASVFYGFEVPSSGAVLLCSCIVAEFLHRDSRWYRFSLSPKAETIDEDHPFFLIKLIAIHPLKHAEESTWDWGPTVKKLNFWIKLIVTISTIFGSLIWAYGHRIWPVCT